MVNYLSLSISTESISIDKNREETVQNWGLERTTANMRFDNLVEFHKFIGFGKV